jgi:serine/threonine protein kinase
MDVRKTEVKPHERANDLNESDNRIEEAISKKYIKYYEYNQFSNFQKIGSGGFGAVYCANWKNSEQPFALKHFLNLDNVTLKELVREVMI